MGVTKLANLVNPQVVADLVETKLTDYMRFLPLAEVDDTLAGRPGDTLYFPVYSYIGAASVTSEGSDVTVATLTATSTSATVQKIGIGVQITDEGAMGGFGDPIGEATKQVAMAIGDAEDTAMYNALSNLSATTGGLVYSVASTASWLCTAILDALELFGEDVDEVKAVVVNPAMYTQMRKATGWLPASEIAANILIRGAVGEFGGCQVIVSNKLKNKEEMYIVKPGALRLVQKRGILVETDRDIISSTNTIVATAHAVAYVYNKAKAIKVYHSKT